MKTKKIQWFLILVLVLSIFTLYKVEKSSAACCTDKSPCYSPDANGKCSSGTPDSRDCSVIGCGPSTSSTGCCTYVDLNGGLTCDSGKTQSQCTGAGQWVAQSCAQACPGTTPATGTSNTTFANPIAYSTIVEVLNAVLNNLMGLIAVISIIFIVIGGLMYMLSGGSESAITRAKKTWTGAVIGLAIALAAPTFLKTIQMLLGGGGTGGSAQNWVDKALTLKQIALNVLNLLLSIFGILAIIALIIGGGTYLTAYGDEKKIDSGKRIITYAIIGIVVALAALVIVRQVGNLLGAKFN